MGLLFESHYTNVLALLVTLVAIIAIWIKWTQMYWSRRGLYNLQPTFFFGNALDVLSQRESFGCFTKRIYDEFKNRDQKHGGLYILNLALYMPVDPDLIKQIMQTDFEHFVNRGVYHNEEVDPLSAHLFSLDDAKWRNLRFKLTPTFTSGKMKLMFDALVKCGNELTVTMDKQVGEQAIDIKNILQRFTIDIIGNVAFGIDCNSLKDPNNEFIKHFKLFLIDDLPSHISGMISFVAPKLANLLKLKIIHSKLSSFFFKLIRDNVDFREKNNIYRKDFMHLLIQLKNRGALSDDGNILNDDKFESKDKITFNELAAQALVFFIAGFETSSTTMTFCLLELALNHEIQEKLREEINVVLEKYNNELTYNAIMDMKYMDIVINETLRKYPPLPGLNRICTKEYTVPGTNFVIEKDTKVWIPVMGLHRDPEFYPDPDEFIPERFLEENKRDRHPYTFIPFGEGPRICIGLRFGLMQAKVGLSILLKNYQFSVNSKTSLPMKYDPKSFILSSRDLIWLDYVKV